MNQLIQFKKGTPLILVALVCLAAFVPKANAALIAYFNFEGTPTQPYPVNLTSSPLGFVQTTTMTLNYASAATSAVSLGLSLNVDPNDVPNNTALGLKLTGANSPANFDIPLFTTLGFTQLMTVTFAYSNHNGFTTVSLQHSTDGGLTFAQSAIVPMVTPVQSGAPMLVTLPIPPTANNAPLLVLRLVFTDPSGGNGNAIRTVVDNIQINGIP